MMGGLLRKQKSSMRNRPSLFLSMSLTPPQPVPQLLCIINSIRTDDEGHMAMGGLFDATPGYWLTRTVLDH
eukprot:c26387_g1_i1 orf=27-239(+)